MGPREAHSQRASVGCQLKQRALAEGKRQGDMGQETRDSDGEEPAGCWAQDYTVGGSLNKAFPLTSCWPQQHPVDCCPGGGHNLEGLHSCGHTILRKCAVSMWWGQERNLRLALVGTLCPPQFTHNPGPRTQQPHKSQWKLSTG